MLKIQHALWVCDPPSVWRPRGRREAWPATGVCQLTMVRPLHALGVLLAALPGWACSVHITTGPSSAANGFGPSRPEPVRAVSVKREPRAHHRRDSESTPPRRERRDVEPRVADRDRDVDHQKRDATQGGTPSRDVATFATSSHTGDGTRRKPRVGDIGRWASPNRDDGQWVSQTDPRRASEVASARSKDKHANAPTEGLPEGDGKLQQLSRPEP